MTLIDHSQRLEATNPHASFIVQAPAGSGKTEILTQRYLRLLNTVTAPEQIIALTFTRKAASEMRERIIIALQQAANNHIGKSPHQQMTLDFAKQALNKDKHYQWNLLQQPNRLKIITIDSLCQSINQAIPLLEQQIVYSQITDKPNSYYLKAASQCIQFALENSSYQEAIKTLLLHVDNKQERLLDLFSALLQQREQWLSILFQARTQEKITFEWALELIEEHELNRFKKSIPSFLAEELCALARELAGIENNPESPRYPLKDWKTFDEITPSMAAALCKMILGSDSNFRKSFDHHVGLNKKDCPDDTYQRLKNHSSELLAKLHDYPDFHRALLKISQLPNPKYNEEQWEVLQALFILLPLLAGHLHVLFSEQNEVDFTAISQQALSALGDEENPTDLALYLDNAIHHLLIDEFQDTSITQFELLTRLVQGWQAGDGKTLFVVGDPMQSIYRFRQAEVGLFFRAKEQGIGPVLLQSLELKCNFRSTATIVGWVNQQFATIFPQQVDMESGAVAFHPSTHVLQDNKQSKVQAFQFDNKTEEAQYLIAMVQQELSTTPNQTLAILVRSRTQLAEIIRLLRSHQIPYQGTDIDLLAHLSHLGDVWSLTQALLAPGNRLSWLAMLRSPYCGLSLKDIHCIAQYEKKKSIYSALLQLEHISGLSEEGLIRSRFFIQVMQHALSQRAHYRLSDWIIKTLQALHVEKILTQNELNDLEQFWTLLDRYESEGRLTNLHEFQKEFAKLYSQYSTPSPLHIMTIHKSKGLEFDTVFLPGLGSQPKRNDNPMLRWLKLPTEQQGNLLLCSPIHAAHQESCPLYDYLTKLDEEKSDYEAQRVLYVAVTRAKSRLYLLDSSDKSYKNSFRSLLTNQEFQSDASGAIEEKKVLTFPLLKKLPLHYYNAPIVQEHLATNPLGIKLTISIPRLIGIMTHQLLHWIGNHHPKTIKDIPWNLVNRECQKLGFNEEIQHLALMQIQEQLTRLFEDAIGSWIMSPHHNEHNEYELLIKPNHTLATRIIDRCFEDKGKLWIIDFKTGKDDVNALKQHQEQLNEYGYYVPNPHSLPIHCGVYYLTRNHWIHWQYESTSAPLIPAL